MKIPETPPDYEKVLYDLVAKDLQKVERILTSVPHDHKGQYVHWEKLKHLRPPKGLSAEQWWAGIKFARLKLSKTIDLLDKSKKPFRFTTPDGVQKDLHWLDKKAAGTLFMDTQIANPQMRNAYIVRSLVNEAIESSQLEGATTTRRVAKEMLRHGRKPKDKSEQMIYNNYRAMQFIREYKKETLTPSFILELHKIVTDKTLDKPGSAGNYRTANDKVGVWDDRDNTLLHTPPNADELPERMDRLCRFANEDSKYFVHPILKAILLHFMLAYDHPFVDGNGRTARALFYWGAAKEGYWLIEYISISEIIKKAPIKYGRAFLHTETDDNDATYFIIHQLDIIKRAIKSLEEYLVKKAQEIRSAERMLDSADRFRGKLNYRQKALLKHALKHPGHVYQINEHQQTNDIAYETARKDLLLMSDKLNLLTKEKLGRAFVFVSPTDLQKKMEETND